MAAAQEAPAARRLRPKQGPQLAQGEGADFVKGNGQTDLRARMKWAATAHCNKSAVSWAVSTGPSRCRSNETTAWRHCNAA
jgi:hypothetical protein